MQTLQPAITVVIPLYNKKAHIVQTVKCVLAQSYAPAEIIVVNDGSTDGGEIELANCEFRNVRIINQKNAGVSAARNCGITASQTEFVALLDADDLWLPHFLEEVSVLINDFPQAGVFSTNYQYKDSDENYFSPNLHKSLCPKTPGILPHFLQMMAEGDLPLTMSSIVIRRSLFDVIGGFPIGEPMGEDQDFLFRAALAQPIAYSPKVLALYVLDSDNRACANNVPREECPFSRRLSFMADHYPFSKSIQHNLKKCSAAHILYLAKRNINVGQFEAARGLLEDPRCNLKPLHKNYYFLRFWLKKMSVALSNFIKARATGMPLTH